MIAARRTEERHLRAGDRARASLRRFGVLQELALAVAVGVLPAGQRARYDEEFRAELDELPRQQRSGHVLRLLYACWSLRCEVLADAPSPAPRTYWWVRRFISTVFTASISTAVLLNLASSPSPQTFAPPQPYIGSVPSSDISESIKAELDQVETAIQEGVISPDEIMRSLSHIEEQLKMVGEAEGKTDLTLRHDQLERELAGLPEEEPGP